MNKVHGTGSRHVHFPHVSLSDLPYDSGGAGLRDSVVRVYLDAGIGIVGM